MESLGLRQWPFHHREWSGPLSHQLLCLNLPLQGSVHPQCRIYIAGGTAATFTAQNPALFTNYGSFYYIICDGVDGGIDAGENIGKGLIKVVEGNELGFAISLTDPSGDYSYFPLKGSRLDRIRFKVLDNRGNIANFNGEQTAFLMKFRPLS